MYGGQELKGPVSEELRIKVMNENELEVLERWFHNAIKATTIGEFVENM